MSAPPPASENASAYRTHIVLVRPPSDADEFAHRLWHESFLPSSRTDSGEPRLVHSYTEAFSGFAARLTHAELQLMTRAKKPGFPDRTLQLMTTHTPEFLGLRQGPGYGKGVVVGLLDVGIYGAHPSFDDHGVAPPPAKWKGSCAGSASRCNDKLVGVRSLVGDDFGHGTHTSSTAAGNFVAGASRDAMYKVCTGKGCAVLAGMDAAIKDGVDVISVSLGGNATFRFDHDPIAIGAFSAVSRGITVVCAAGNNGPKLASVVNHAPWLITVAASSMDRSLPAEVQLGEGVTVAGEAINQVTKNSRRLSCGKLPRTVEAQLNYPMIKVPLQPAPFTVKRTVTNVGPPPATYTAKVEVPKALTVRVSPGTLVFTEAGEKKTFSVTVSGHGGDVLQGTFSWVSGKHVVRSPIVADSPPRGYEKDGTDTINKSHHTFDSDK